MILDSKTNNKLFLICPDCYIENRIRSKFQGNLFFITALGSVLNSIDSNFIKSVKELLVQEDITEICIVNDTSCRFLESVIKGKKGYSTSAEKELKWLLSNYLYRLNHLDNIKETSTELAKHNLIHQKKRFMKTSIFKTHLESNPIKLTMVLFDRTKDEATIMYSLNS
jgi:carbonic anhydrase